MSRLKYIGEYGLAVLGILTIIFGITSVIFNFLLGFVLVIIGMIVILTGRYYVYKSKKCRGCHGDRSKEEIIIKKGPIDIQRDSKYYSGHNRANK
jgi:hypothetical protein